MTTVVILLVLAAATIVTTVALMLAERDMKSIIGAQQYAVLSSAAAYVDEQLDAKRAMLASLAEGLPPGIHNDPAALQALLSTRSVVRAEFFNIVVFDRGGRLAATMRQEEKDDGVDAAGHPYFDNTVKTRKGLISAPFVSRLSGRAIVLLTQPVLDPAGDVAYVITASIDLQKSDFFGPINALKPGKTGFMYIMTTDGVLIHHPTASRVLQHIHARPGHNRATDMALAGFEGWTEAKNKDGNDGIYSYKRLTTTNWIVGARYPTAEAFAPLAGLRTQAILAASLFAAVAGVVAWLAIARLLDPLQRLRSRLAHIRQGSADIESLRSASQDELGELSEAFYRLTAERAATQERVLASETLVRNILEHAPDAFVSANADGVITEWNVQAEQTFGWRRDEAVGRSVTELIVPPSMRDAHTAGMARFAASGSGPLINSRVRVTALHRDGHEIPVELSIGALRDGGSHLATAFLHDISDRVAYEEKIAASERRARMIADSMPALVAYVDRERRYRFTNGHYQYLLGLDPRAMLGRTMEDVFGADVYAHWADMVDAALRGERLHEERDGSHHGRQLHLMVDMVPDVDAAGAVAGFYLMAMDITERKSAELKLAELARVDSLTGIANRRKFDELLCLAMERSKRHGSHMALAYLDIDNFKAINDSLGHGAGDEVLKEFASRLTAIVRSVDLVARLAGDEFIIVFESVAPPDEAAAMAAQMAAKVVAAIRHPFDIGAGPMRVTTSIGIALYAGDGETQPSLISRADRALYSAKHNGRDCYVVDGLSVT